MTNINISNPNNFVNFFVREYCDGGFGRMNKRDIDVLVFYLLIEDGQYKLPDQMFKACRELKLTETKIRNLYQDVQIRYKQYSEAEAKDRFIKLVQEGAFESKKHKITFVVREPLLRQYFEEWVSKMKGFTDTSFNKNLVTLDKQIFMDVLNYLAADDLSAVQGKFSGELSPLNKANDRRGLTQLFVEEFVKSAGKEAGSMSVNSLAMGLKMLLTGMLS